MATKPIHPFPTHSLCAKMLGHEAPLIEEIGRLADVLADIADMLRQEGHPGAAALQAHAKQAYAMLAAATKS